MAHEYKKVSDLKVGDRIYVSPPAGMPLATPAGYPISDEYVSTCSTILVTSLTDTGDGWVQINELGAVGVVYSPDATIAVPVEEDPTDRKVADNWALLDGIREVLDRPATASYIRLVAISEIVADLDIEPVDEDQRIRDQVDDVLLATGMYC